MQKILASSLIFLWLATNASTAPLTNDEIIEKINSMNSTWKAVKNFDDDVNWRRLLGAIYKDNKHLHVMKHDESGDLPKNFDGRTHWVNCTSLNEVRNQGGCGSCWAFSSVEVMTDRICIHSQGKVDFHYSAEDVLSCCDTCGLGCGGGSPGQAFKYWVKTGIVSGGNYNSKKGCRPYSIEEKIPKNDVDTPDCVKECQENYNATYESDLRFGESAYTIEQKNETQMMQEILTNGPVSAGFEVYNDFNYYSHGVYQHTYGELRGSHAIKVLGWGVEKDTPYWLCANSWGPGWGGLNGFLRF